MPVASARTRACLLVALLFSFAAAASAQFITPPPTRLSERGASPAPKTPAPPADTSAAMRAGPAAVSATVSMDVLDNSRPLARGDVVNFRVVEDREAPVSLRVNDSGDIEVPYIGTVRARGKTPRSLAFELKALLERDYYHNATVIIGLDVEGQRPAGLIYVSGAVNGGGPMEIPFNEKFTVSKAVLRAGGFADFANQRRVKLTRTAADGRTDTFTVDVKEIIEKGRQDLDVEVQPNDFIVVPERLINF